MLFTLKDHGIKAGAVIAAAKSVNDSQALPQALKTVGIKGEDLMFNLIVALNTLTKEQFVALPDDVKVFYEGIPDDIFRTIPENSVVPESGYLKSAPVEPPQPAEVSGGDDEGPEITSDCPTFKTGWNPSEPDCQECATVFALEHDACKAAVEASKAPKATPKKAPKQPYSGTPAKRLRTRYGHAVGSMAGDIDDMVYLGMTIADMAALLATRHSRTPEKATAKVRAHIKHLIQDLKLTVPEVEGAVHCKQAYSEGFTAENSQLSYVA